MIEQGALEGTVRRCVHGAWAHGRRANGFQSNRNRGLWAGWLALWAMRATEQKAASPQSGDLSIHVLGTP